MISQFSYHAINTYRRCPRQFKFRYLEKIPVEKRPTVELHIGNVIHRVLEELYKRGANNIVMTLDEMHDLYSSHWNSIAPEKLEVSSEYMGIDDFYNNGLEMLDAYYKKHTPFKLGKLYGTEMRLHYTLPGTASKFRGTIDRLWERPDGVVEITDYKTGQHLAQPKSKEFFYQMGLYQLMVQQSYPMIEEVELVQYFLKMGCEVKLRMTQDDLEILREELRQVILETIHAERLDDFPPKESSYCKFCEYTALCPAKRHQQMIEEEEQMEKIPSDATYLRNLANKYLTKHRQSSLLKAEVEALKNDLAEVAEVHGVTKIEGDEGTVSVRLYQEDKFVTKTESPSDFAELVARVRAMQLDEYLTVDARGLMKDGYLAGRLTDEQKGKLEEFVATVPRQRITARFKKTDDD